MALTTELVRATQGCHYYPTQKVSPRGPSGQTHAEGFEFWTPRMSAMAAVPAATGTRKRVLFPAPQTLHQAAEPPGQAPAASGAAAPRFGRPRFVSPAAIFAPSEDAGEWRERRPPADSEATCSFAQTEDSQRWLSRPGEAAAIDREPATGTHVPVRSQPPRALATPGSSAVDDECIDLTVPAHLGCLATKIVGQLCFSRR